VRLTPREMDNDGERTLQLLKWYLIFKTVAVLSDWRERERERERGI